jgi:hypothetical protein
VLFEKLIQQITGKLMLEMAILTNKGNKIIDYPELKVVINQSTDEPIIGARQEHDPPHFHLIANRFDVSISLPDYELIAVRLNHNNRLFIKNINNLSWQTSGQISLRKALVDWLLKNTNEEQVFTIWNGNNPTLSTAFFNFDQTKKYINKLIVKTKSKLDRDDLLEIASEHSFINRDTLSKVLDSLGVK